MKINETPPSALSPRRYPWYEAVPEIPYIHRPNNSRWRGPPGKGAFTTDTPLRSLDLVPVGLGPTALTAPAQASEHQHQRSRRSQTTMRGYVDPEALVTTPWLERHLADPILRVVDIHSPMGRSPEEYAAGHIPGAVLCDLLEDTSDITSDIPCRVADPARFEAAMSRLGIGASTHVVAYDHEFGCWAARLWWALRYYGHDRVSLLDGGIKAWLASEGPLESGVVSVAPANFTVAVRPELRASLDEVKAARERGDVLIVDALPGKIYRGEVPMFPTHRLGHIPGAHNVSARLNVDRASGLMLDADQLAEVWKRLNLKPAQRVITYCGGGDYGSFDLFVLHLLGHDNAALYDGSWFEWGAREDLPVEIGAEPAFSAPA